MLDHMLFNVKKWFNVADKANNVVIDNKEFIAIPKKITCKKGARFAVYFDITRYTTIESKTITLKVDGIFHSQNKFYYLIVGDIGSYSGNPFCISLDDPYVTPIWGGKKFLLSVLYQGFKSLLKMEVA